MSVGRLAVRSCALAALVVTAGCAPPGVKDVLNNRPAYVSQNFSLNSVPASLRDKVSAQDSTALGFNRMVVDTAFAVSGSNNQKDYTLHEKRTLVSLGGAFEQEVSEFSKNDIPTMQWYGVSYRGVLPLRSQRVHVGAQMSNFVLEVKSLHQFEPLHPVTGGHVGFSYEQGTSPQLVNFKSGRYDCAWGATYPASRLHETLQGDAQDLECTLYNDNGAVSGKERFAFLKRYGTGLMMHMDSATDSMDGHIDSVSLN